MSGRLDPQLGPAARRRRRPCRRACKAHSGFAAASSVEKVGTGAPSNPPSSVRSRGCRSGLRSRPRAAISSHTLGIPAQHLGAEPHDQQHGRIGFANRGLVAELDVADLHELFVRDPQEGEAYAPRVLSSLPACDESDGPRGLRGRDQAQAAHVRAAEADGPRARPPGDGAHRRRARTAGVRRARRRPRPLPETIERYFGDRLTYRLEEELLGTAGGVVNVADFFGEEEIVVISGRRAHRH